MAMTFGRNGIRTSDGAVAFQFATSMGKPMQWGTVGQPSPKVFLRGSAEAALASRGKNNACF